MGLDLLIEDAEKEGEFVPRGSFDEIFNIVIDRHLSEHMFYNHLTEKEAKKDFGNKYRDLAKKMYEDCFSSGKAVFDIDKYSCGLFGVAEKTVLSIMNQFVRDVSKREGLESFGGELRFVHDYAFVMKEIFCESCPHSTSCVDYQTYVGSNGWKKYTPELVASG